MKTLLRISLFLSLTEAAASLVVYVRTLFGASISGWQMLVFFAGVLLLGLVYAFLSTTVAEWKTRYVRNFEKSESNFAAFFRQAPFWTKWVVYASFAWFLSNFVILIYETGGTPMNFALSNAVPVSVLRTFSAGWAATCLLLAQIFYMAIRLDGYCLNGHRAAAHSAHCGQCMALVIDWSPIRAAKRAK